MTSPVVFVIPPKKNLSVAYPLGLAYIASILKKNHYGVRIFDFSQKFYSTQKCIKEIVKVKPDFIGLSIHSFNYNVSKEIIFDIKKLLPQTKIIIGGPHISALPKFSLYDLGADFAIVGEGEFVTLELIKRINANYHCFNDIKGLAFWRENIPILNPGCNMVDNLDDLPFPAWEIAPPNTWKDIAGHLYYKKFPVAPLITSRGCPYNCYFCASHVIHGSKFRKRTAQNVVDEIQFLVRTYGAKEITIFDDTFTEEKQHAIEICEAIIRRKLNIIWRTAVGLRLDTLDEEILDIFKRSGCYQLGFGIESFSQNILNRIKKPIVKPKILEKIKIIKKFNIETFGYFILGLPEDTEESIKETIEIARNSDLDYLSFTHAIPFPGSELFKKRYNESDLKSIHWDNFYVYTHNPFDISKIAPGKLKHLFFYAYISSYTKFRRFKKILKNVLKFNPVVLKKLIRFICYVFKNYFQKN